jgi:hypothetical protein
MKKDVKDLGASLPEVLKLRPVTFRWKSGPDARLHYGLIAQEVEKVLPEVVVHGSNPDEALGMNYAELVPVLIAAIKTQEERIAKLEQARAPVTASMLGGNTGLGIVAGLAPLGLVVALRKRKNRNAS